MGVEELLVLENDTITLTETVKGKWTLNCERKIKIQLVLLREHSQMEPGDY